MEQYQRRRSALHQQGIFGHFFNRSGYVLIIVLIIIALLISVSAEFLITAQTNTRYLRKLMDRQKANMIAKAGINLAVYILQMDLRGIDASLIPGKKSDKNADSYHDIWAMDFPPLQINDGLLKITISDENAKININTLSNEYTPGETTPFYLILQRLFLNMGFTPDLADAILDWSDVDDIRAPYGAESSDYYLHLKKPYTAKNGKMDSIHELFMVRGFTPEIVYGLGGGNFGKEKNLVDNNKGQVKLDENVFSTMGGLKSANVKDAESKIGPEKSRRLFDYLRVHGDRLSLYNEINKININTASYRILSALTDTMTDDIVSEIISRRKQQPFTSITELEKLIPDENLRKNILTVKSYIFKIEVVGIINNTEAKITTFYFREPNIFFFWCES